MRFRRPSGQLNFPRLAEVVDQEAARQSPAGGGTTRVARQPLHAPATEMLSALELEFVNYSMSGCFSGPGPGTSGAAGLLPGWRPRSRLTTSRRGGVACRIGRHGRTLRRVGCQLPRASRRTNIFRTKDFNFLNLPRNAKKTSRGLAFPKNILKSYVQVGWPPGSRWNERIRFLKSEHYRQMDCTNRRPNKTQRGDCRK